MNTEVDRDDFPPSEEELDQEYRECKLIKIFQPLEGVRIIMGDGCNCPDIQRFYCEYRINKLLNKIP